MFSLNSGNAKRMGSACAALLIAAGVTLPTVAQNDVAQGQIGTIYYDDSAYLGVGVEEEIEYPGGGARITYIVDESPASRAGLQAGDVILRVDGKRVYGPRGLTKQIESADAGDAVELVVARNGREMNFEATLEERSKSRTFGLRGENLAKWGENWEEFGERWGEWGEKFGQEFAERYPGQVGTWDVNPDGDHADVIQEQLGELSEYLAQLPNLSTATGNFFHCEDGDCETNGYFHVGQRPTLGVHLVATTAELREHMGGDRDRGVLISKIESDSPAEEAGIEVGDLILSINDQDVASTQQLRRALEGLHGETVDVEVSRNGRNRSLIVTFPEKAVVRGYLKPNAQNQRFPSRFKLERLPADTRIAEVYEQGQRIEEELRQRRDQRQAELRSLDARRLSLERVREEQTRAREDQALARKELGLRLEKERRELDEDRREALRRRLPKHLGSGNAI